ncbi:MAG: PEGA domain-containing protein [Lachnospiraceae bacterium]|nr:PEGA domain-containing protein [Lachnospiraceae bacterium]
MNRTLVVVLAITVLTFIGFFYISDEYVERNRKNRVTSAGSEKDLESESEDILIEGAANKLTAVIRSLDTEGAIISVRDVESGRDHIFSYVGASTFYNKYGDSIVPKELECGQIVDIDHTSDGDLIKSLRISDKMWEMTDVVKYSLDEKKKIIELAGTSYKYSDNLEIFSNGKKAEWMDITNLDTLTVRGIEKKVLSIVIKRGHGYIRLKNDSYFVGGYIEVGKDVITEVTEDMLLPVPEGEFEVRLTNKGYLAKKEVNILRDKETVIDLKEVPIEEVALGHVEFHLSPVYAQLYIDNEIYDYDERIPLEYGVHSIRVEAAGYETVNTNIKVGSEYANVEISLDPSEGSPSSSDKAGSGSDSKGSDTGSAYAPSSIPSWSVEGSTTVNNQGSSDPLSSSSESGGISTTSGTSATSATSATSSVKGTSSSSSTEVISSQKKIRVEQPEGAEVYLDSKYIGITPASTNKVTGTHVITLRKDGYQTRSYTVDIDNDGNDITFSFAALIEEE